MKSVLFICCLFAAGLSSATPQDSTKRNGPFRHFNLSFNWLELGGNIALKTTEPENSPPGVNEYLNSKRKGTHYGVFGVSCYYKQKFGFGLMFNSYELQANSNAFRDYLTIQYPNYFMPKTVNNYSYSVQAITFNFSYRKHFKYFFIEPKLRIGFNSYNSSTNGFRLKEQGSNQYINYSISEQKKGLKNSYHAAFNIAHRFRKIDSFPFGVELGGSAEFFIAPIQSQITFSETPYNGATSSSTYEMKRWNPVVSFSAVLNLYF